MRELIAKLEAATGPDRELDWRIAEKFDIPDRWPASTQWPPFSPKSKYDKSIPTLTASIDAAVALAERVLPGWKKQILENWRGTWIARVTSPRHDTYSTDYMRERDPDGSPNGAIAICIAILRAAKESASQEGSEPS